VKALYLDGGTRRLDVRLDGPALRVRRPGRADGQYPLQRISRIIVLGTVQWHEDAMGACMSQQKPVAVLDHHGRFVRLWFRPAVPVHGLTRRIGSLLDMPRFLERYQRWFSSVERSEMSAALQRLNIDCGKHRPDIVWQRVCFQQYLRHKSRVGGSYRYLSGLAAAQIASALSATGIPCNPLCWGRQEYRIFLDMMRLERWKLAVLLEKLMESRDGQTERRNLIEAFEGTSEDREQRIAAWRQAGLVAMMGLDSAERKPDCEQAEPQWHLLDRLCKTAGNFGSNFGQVPFGKRESLRSSIKILREYLRCDRRTYESYRTA